MKPKHPASQPLAGGVTILYSLRRLWMLGCWKVRRRLTIYSTNQHIKELEHLAAWEKSLPHLRLRETSAIADGKLALRRCDRAIQCWREAKPLSSSPPHPGDLLVGLTASSLLLLLWALGVL